VGGRPEVLYSVARVQNDLLIMDRKDGNGQWPMLLALAPALLVSGGSYNSKNVYKNTAHGYSFSVPTAWEPSDIKYLNNSDVLWFWEAKDAVVWLDYATFGFNLSEKVLGEKVVAAEKGNFASQGKVMLGKKAVNWYSFYYEHSRGKRQRIVYVLQNKGRHLLLNVELPDVQYATQKKYFDGLLKAFKWL
jgi:hypothetical protein